MTQARSQIIDLDYTPYYHCISRCVRRAFLCGQDYHTGQSFEHRRQWILNLLSRLSETFCIDICAYALMSNHYHLVLHVDRKRCLRLSDKEVVRRWLMFYRGNALIQQFLEDKPVSDSEMPILKQQIEKWRHRLYDISWFMKILNERIARRANKEDQCKGKFWEYRFKCQALLDETALLSCMAYVDLNPIRAGLSESLEGSAFTSIQVRLQAYTKSAAQSHTSDPAAQLKPTEKPLVANSRKDLAPSPGSGVPEQYPATPCLMPFLPDARKDTKSCRNNTLPLREPDYFQWVEYLGKTARLAKPGRAPKPVLALFDKFQLQTDRFLNTLDQLETHYPVRMGQYETLLHYAKHAGLRWSHGLTCSRRLHKAA